MKPLGKLVRPYVLANGKSDFPSEMPGDLKFAVVHCLEKQFQQWRPTPIEIGPGMGLTDRQLEECRKFGISFLFTTIEAPPILIPECPDCNGELATGPVSVVECKGCGRAEAGRTLKEALKKFGVLEK